MKSAPLRTLSNASCTSGGTSVLSVVAGQWSKITRLHQRVNHMYAFTSRCAPFLDYMEHYQQSNTTLQTTQLWLYHCRTPRHTPHSFSELQTTTYHEAYATQHAPHATHYTPWTTHTTHHTTHHGHHNTHHTPHQTPHTTHQTLCTTPHSTHHTAHHTHAPHTAHCTHHAPHHTAHITPSTHHTPCMLIICPSLRAAPRTRHKVSTNRSKLAEVRNIFGEPVPQQLNQYMTEEASGLEQLEASATLQAECYMLNRGNSGSRLHN